jgi:exodeoxyribonuclease VII small subunit
MKLEESLAELKSVVEQMQRGSGDFDKQVALYKQGKSLVQSCLAFLDQAEMEVNLLTADGELEPFGEE